VRQFHVINLGAGVQSTAFFMMVHMKLIPMPEDTVCIFADTQDEEDETYAHLDWLKSLEWPRCRSAACSLTSGVAPRAAIRHPKPPSPQS
jgi:hypothetical protein